ncbi:Resolvase, holliday junction-type, YqgF-like protein [Corchorus olitorius]|uniref:Resolvase, holliday junction-type, YqgF-like protein n=1 Tax=Corchorus olitorius TaxID=93759 RepID=A0A1R3K0P9_9ROSI|nr:Resolvase, holliday junction-type, YqgF-like protein [Corchorus olitorius]
MYGLQLQSQPFFNLRKTLQLQSQPSSLPFISTCSTSVSNPTFRALSSIQEFPPNAVRRKSDPQWRGGFSLGVDLGLSRTGLALSKGFSVRPLTVLKLRGQKLELQLLEIAENEEADEFIIGLPKSWDGKETPQSNKVRSIAGRLAVRAAERGWRVYLQDEHGTSTEASDRMINLGIGKSARQKSSDAYAAVILLERYFAMSGKDIEIVLPKQMDLQEKLRRGSTPDIDFYPEEFVG